MNPWKVILATLVIFCSGLVTGALMVKNFSRPERSKPAGAHSGPGASASLPPQQKDLLRRMDKELHLTAEQQAGFEKILKSSQERTKKIRDKIAPELKEEVKQLHAEMRVQLTPEQQEKFDRVIKLKSPKKGDKTDDSTEDRRRKQSKDGTRRENTNTPVKTP